MSKKASLSLQQLKTLCDFNGKMYISKQGSAYIEALSKLYDLNNKNDYPFSRADICSQPQLCEFSFSGITEYKYVCKLKANPMEIINDKRKNEKINGTDSGNDYTRFFCGVHY